MAAELLRQTVVISGSWPSADADALDTRSTSTPDVRRRPMLEVVPDE